MSGPPDREGQPGEEPEEWFEQADEPDVAKLVGRPGQGLRGFGAKKQEGEVKEPAAGGEGVEQEEKKRETRAVGERDP